MPIYITDNEGNISPTYFNVKEINITNEGNSKFYQLPYQNIEIKLLSTSANFHFIKNIQNKQMNNISEKIKRIDIQTKELIYHFHNCLITTCNIDEYNTLEINIIADHFSTYEDIKTIRRLKLQEIEKNGTI